MKLLQTALPVAVVLALASGSVAAQEGTARKALVVSATILRG